MIEEQNEDIGRLIERDRTFLLSQALSITGKTEDAEDLLQETIMKACKGFNSFERDSNFLAWTRTIMINTHINRMRQKVSKILPMEDSYLNRENVFLIELTSVSQLNDPEKMFFQNYISKEIMEPFYSLPEKYRTVFSLFHFDGYPYDVISRIINVPIGTVKSRLYRAKQYLTEQIINTKTPKHNLL